MSKPKPNKKTNLFIILSSIFLANAILAELIGVKIFSVEGTLGIPPFDIMGYSLNQTAGVLIWPVVFLVTDIINEYFGKEGVRKISFITVGLIAYIFLIITVATQLSPAEAWVNSQTTDADGNPFNLSFAFNTIFTQGLGIIVGSIVAFLIGQFVDVYVFSWIRKYTGKRMVWLRATGSTAVSQLVDSFVVLVVAFYIFGNMQLGDVLAISLVNYIYKFVVAVVLTPVIYLSHYLIDNYLGIKAADRMIEKAAEDEVMA